MCESALGQQEKVYAPAMAQALPLETRSALEKAMVRFVRFPAARIPTT
jgi:hypothetical protein